MFPQFYYNLDRYTQSLIVFIVSLIAGFVIRFIILKSFAVLARRVKGVAITSIYKRTKASWFLFIPLVLFLLLFPSGKFSPAKLEIVLNIIETLIIISFGVLAIRLVYVLQDVVVSRYDTTKADNIRERKIRTQLAFVIRMLIVMIVIIMIAVILMNIKSVRHYGAALFTSAGLAGVILGFAAQKSLANILAGFQIALTQPIRLDDAVLIEGEWG